MEDQQQKVSLDQDRPIIVNFFRQREAIRALRLKFMQPYGISEDFPIEIRKTREQLLPQLMELKQKREEMWHSLACTTNL